MVFTSEKLCDACYDDNIQTVRDNITNKEVYINDIDNEGDTSLTDDMRCNEEEIVEFLLSYN